MGKELKVGMWVKCIKPSTISKKLILQKDQYYLVLDVLNGQDVIVNVAGTPQLFTSESGVFDLKNPFCSKSLNAEVGVPDPFSTAAKIREWLADSFVKLSVPNVPLSVLQEAEALINGDREQDYGAVTTNFANIAKGWSVIFGCNVTPKQVGLAMAWLKIARETNKAKRDNIVDACGYLGLVEKLEKEGSGV